MKQLVMKMQEYGRAMNFDMREPRWLVRACHDKLVVSMCFYEIIYLTFQVLDPKRPANRTGNRTESPNEPKHHSNRHNNKQQKKF